MCGQHQTPLVPHRKHTRLFSKAVFISSLGSGFPLATLDITHAIAEGIFSLANSSRTRA
jgi:hypothetical protein